MRFAVAAFVGLAACNNTSLSGGSEQQRQDQKSSLVHQQVGGSGVDQSANALGATPGVDQAAGGKGPGSGVDKAQASGTSGAATPGTAGALAGSPSSGLASLGQATLGSTTPADGSAAVTTTTTPPPPPACDIYFRTSVLRGNLVRVYIPGVALTPGMSWEQNQAIAQSPVFQGHTTDSILNVDGFSGVADQGPVPATLQYNGQTWPLMTNGQLGSTQCPVTTGANESPLVVDVACTSLVAKCAAIALTQPNQGVAFDILGNGTKAKIAWPVDPSTKLFLVLDRGDGRVTGINELFGNNTVGPDGRKAANGFEALRKWDANGDGVIDAKDPVFAKLRLWADLNHDGVADPGELRPLADYGVKSFDLRYTEVAEALDVFGDGTRQRSVVDFADGHLALVYDLWFAPATN